MQFRTVLQPTPSALQFGLEDKILSLGSCFSDSIGQKLNDHKFKIQYNPLGVLFNPISIFKLIDLAFGNEEFNQHHFTQQNGIWHHFDFHSKLQANTKEQLLILINQQLEHIRKWTQESKIVILTFGTAWVHQLIKTQQIVANCHKVANKNFSKRLLSLEEMEKGFELFLSLLPKNTQLIVTVSPIRHTRETLPLNQVSKSLLRVFCHQIAEKYPQVNYFPSYELLLDDLRDYRFYKDDLIHPSDFAINYIWETFIETHISKNSQAFISEWTKIRAALNHKPNAPDSEAHQKFIKKLLNHIQQLPDYVDVTLETQKLKAQLID